MCDEMQNTDINLLEFDPSLKECVSSGAERNTSADAVKLSNEETFQHLSVSVPYHDLMAFGVDCSCRTVPFHD